MLKRFVQDARVSRRSSDLLLLGAAPRGLCGSKAGISSTIASKFVVSLIL